MSSPVFRQGRHCRAQGLHLRPASNVEAYHAIVADLRIEDQSQDRRRRYKTAADESGDVTKDELRDHWSKMTDTHEFLLSMLRKLKIGRQAAVHCRRRLRLKLDNTAAIEMMHASVKSGLPIMCFVGNDGIVQIHPARSSTSSRWVRGSTSSTRPSTCTCVRITSPRSGQANRPRMATSPPSRFTALQGEMIIQFFSKRKEGSEERAERRDIVESLPKATSVAA